MGQWLDAFNTWLAMHPQWLGLALFLAAFTECLAIVGLVIPGTVLLLAIAVAAGSGALPLGQTLLLAYVGGLLGDLVSYAIGRRYHQGIRRLPGLRRHPEWLQRAEVFARDYGAASLLVGRFIGPLRPMLPMTAGMLDMPFGRFVLVSVIASAGWAVAYLMPGWTAGAALRLSLPEGFWPEAAIVAAGIALLVGTSVHCSLRGVRMTAPLMAALSAVALLAMFIGWPYLDAFDKGLMDVVQAERSPLGDYLMVVITRMGDFRTQLLAAVLLIVLLLMARQWRSGAFATLALLGTALGNGTLKALFARVRPDILAEPLTSFSFPSGHSSAAFAFFLVLGILAGRGQPPRLRLTWLVLAAIPATAIALSRVYLGVHWPTDIIGGALLAATFCAASLAIIQRRRPLGALAPRAWWLIMPSTLALLGLFAVWALPDALAVYRY